jgi:hypothetical protein
MTQTELDRQRRHAWYLRQLELSEEQAKCHASLMSDLIDGPDEDRAIWAWGMAQCGRGPYPQVNFPLRVFHMLR